MQVLAEVDGRIFKEAIAARHAALAASAVQSDISLDAASHVSHVNALTLLAVLQIRVSMKLRNLRGWNAAFSMQSIDVLTHDKLQMVLFHELNERHMSLGRVRLLDREHSRRLLLARCGLTRRLIAGSPGSTGRCRSWLLSGSPGGASR